MSDVRDFGATGDGKTDDTEAILHAVDQSDGYLFFPPGRYLISRTIDVPLDRRGPIALEGAGSTARLIIDAPEPAVRLTGTHSGTAWPKDAKPGEWQRERMPTVKNLAIECTHPDADGIELTGTLQALLEGLHIRQLRHAIHLVKRNRNVIISQCQIYHNRGIGIYLDDVDLHQINVVGNHISYNRLGGIRIERSKVHNLQITGNDIEYNNNDAHGGEPEPTAEIYIDTTAPGTVVTEVEITSNTIQATNTKGGANIRILDQTKPQKKRRPGLITVAGNVIGNQEINVHLTGCHGVVLSGNTIYSCDKYNVLVERSNQINLCGNSMRRHDPRFLTGVRLVDSHNCVMSGCTIEDESPEGQASGVSTLEIAACRRVNVSGSQFLSGVPYCADVTDSSFVNFSGCTLADTRTERTTKAALRFQGSGEGNLVSGCTLGPAAGPATDIDRASSVTLAGNVLVDGKPR